MTELEQEIAHLQKLQAKHRKNIRTLEETLANYGMARPLHLLNDLNFEQEQLRQVERRLEKLAAPADPGEAPTATALGDFFTTIRGVKMDLATFEDFLARLRKDELAFEQVGARRWRAKWYGIETGYVIALPIGDELELDFYLMKWDQDPQAVAYEEDNGETTIDYEPNIWPQAMVNSLVAGLLESGALQDEGPTPTSTGDDAGNKRFGEIPARGESMDWDVFISHAWEDKEAFARPLVRHWKEKGAAYGSTSSHFVS